jgi:hypothetical protein
MLSRNGREDSSKSAAANAESHEWCDMASQHEGNSHATVDKQPAIKETCLVEAAIFSTESTYSPGTEPEINSQDKSTQTRHSKTRNSVSARNGRIALKHKDDKVAEEDDLTSASNMLQNYTTSLVSNLKTAFMLFVVTLIMAIVYTPALLTSLGYINYNPLHWNIIYLNNAANPLVYSFLNANFRKSLRSRFRTCQIC